MKPKDKADHDDHSNQLKPNNDAYWQSRGNDSRPEDWDDDDDRNNSYDDYDDDGYEQEYYDNDFEWSDN